MELAPTMIVQRAGRRAIVAALAAVLAGACAQEPRPRPQSGPNPASKGVIDTPRADERVGPTIVVAGWVVDEAGVDRVRLYVDDRLAATVRVELARPDVEKAFPHFARPEARHGWQARLDFGEFVGYVTLHAEALDGRGALTRFAQVTVKVDP